MEISTILSIITTIGALLAIAASMNMSRQKIKSDETTSLAQIQAARESSDLLISANVLSANRQVWINDVRNTIANFIVAVHHLKIVSSDGKLGDDIHQLAKSMNEPELHLKRLELLSNPNESYHIELIRLCIEYYNTISDDSINEKECEKNLIRQGQIVLKREWERVKSLT